MTPTSPIFQNKDWYWKLRPLARMKELKKRIPNASGLLHRDVVAKRASKQSCLFTPTFRLNRKLDSVQAFVFLSQKNHYYLVTIIALFRKGMTKRFSVGSFVWLSLI